MNHPSEIELRGRAEEPVDEILGAGPAPGAILRDLTAEIRRLNDRSEGLEAINKRMHERVAALEGDLLRASLRPVIKALAELHGECHRYAQHVRVTADTELTLAFAEDFGTAAGRIEDILEALGAVSIEAAVGDPYDRRIHQPCATVATDVEARHDRVGAVYHQGFRHIGSDQPVVHAKVSVWKYLAP
ncbi:nucleotide exchange factor GrpE [Nocardia sp. alder85J]|uniref:nucleotide exchange factor GrpE n=1 Tax=Nocardia sp. alder85J TaxID=2862949 RepID=UPI001CD56432|nr:nucleotide exchange factor GrpE [Nocardia sp. alder85J]MCX4090750.1 nucleotide exchange factor GrpE [Nocardia sp. alder85J]